MNNYEKKYKEALEKFDVILNLNTVKESGTIFVDDVRKIFPELKESEDEKIRRFLIDFIKVCGWSEKQFPHREDCVAWLEKQGNIDLEFFENGENEKREFVGYGFLKCKGDFLSFKEGETYWLEYMGKDNYNVRSDNLLGQTFHITPQQLYTVFRPTTWLEKQGEQKPQGKTALEAINEEKVDNANKKELKKIEDEIEIPYGAKDSELQEDTYYIPKGFHAEIDKDKVVIKKGEKPTWSEEYIADVFEKVGLAKIVREQSNDALTIALQDAMIELSKVTLQQKPAWSEEDTATICRVICIVKWAAYSNHSHPILNDEGATELIERLQSLRRPMKWWRPTWGQLDALEYHLKHTNENSRLYKETKKLYDQLKRL